MMFGGIKVVIDTSAIIQLRMERYAPDVFPSLNCEVERAAKSINLVTVDRVVDELKTKASISEAGTGPTTEQTSEWVGTALPLINDVVPVETITEIAKLTAEVASKHQRWSVGVPADPMLIAVAEVVGCAVISGEVPRIHDRCEPKPISGSGEVWNQYGHYSSWITIPDICLIRGIQHHDLLSFFRTQDWSF